MPHIPFSSRVFGSCCRSIRKPYSGWGLQCHNVLHHPAITPSLSLPSNYITCCCSHHYVGAPILIEKWPPATCAIVIIVVPPLETPHILSLLSLCHRPKGCCHHTATTTTKPFWAVKKYGSVILVTTEMLAARICSCAHQHSWPPPFPHSHQHCQKALACRSSNILNINHQHGER